MKSFKKVPQKEPGDEYNTPDRESARDKQEEIGQEAHPEVAAVRLYIRG